MPLLLKPVFTNSSQTFRDRPAVVGLRGVWQGLRHDCDFAYSAKARFGFCVSCHVMKRPFAILLGCLFMGSVAFAFCCIDCQENFKARPTAYKVLPKEKAK